MTVQVAVRPAAAISELAFQLGYAGGKLPIYTDGRPNTVRTLDFDTAPRIPTGERLARLTQRIDLQRSEEVAVGLPTIASYVHYCTVLWAWTKGSEQTRRAARFSPKPSIVLRLGTSSERLLLWGLKLPVSVGTAEVYNSRIAYALHAPRTRTKADALRIPMPGSFMRVGRQRPVPVLVTRLGLGGLHYEAVAGSLKDAPPKDAWKDRPRR